MEPENQSVSYFTVLCERASMCVCVCVWERQCNYACLFITYESRDSWLW